MAIIVLRVTKFNDAGAFVKIAFFSQKRFTDVRIKEEIVTAREDSRNRSLRSLFSEARIPFCAPGDILFAAHRHEKTA